MDPQIIGMIYASTAVGVSLILALAGIGSALGWGLITSRFIESIARQPELRPMLTGQVLFVGGLMESFPFIVLGISMWFTFANPFVSGATAAAKALAGG
ncbi:MAG: F0F1 ATP synthase subunit C [Nevskiaceae bacterium]|nr:MAG: F0F1 ATP synthase subunit C [Nevskiaceae bacterium]TBR73570.1 MAG: F0F1 ATP synthase subunit C [Nevskiaceae bacterium]